jgi:hypothetical protein
MSAGSPVRKKETDERVHSPVPGDEEDDKNACEERQPESGLVDHVGKR